MARGRMSTASSPSWSRPFVFGVVTDIHFGPEAFFEGRLRKLTAHAPELATAFAERMRREVRPDLVIHLGDAIEDASPADDLARYHACLAHLEAWGGPVTHIAGNHDLIHLRAEDLRRAWGMGSTPGPLYRSFDVGPLRVLCLHTHEEKDVRVYLDEPQLAWVDDELARHAERDVMVLMHHSAADQDTRDNRWFSRCPHLALVDNRRELRTRLARHGRVRLVLNGHLHWNHVAVHHGIPFLTLQSLVENLDDDAPGRAAAAHAVVRVHHDHLTVDIAGAAPAHHRFDAVS